MESLDEFCNYLQIKLEKDFGYDDDTVINTVERSMDELKRGKLDYPGPPQPHELPRQPFGTFKEPTFTSKVLLLFWLSLIFPHVADLDLLNDKWIIFKNDGVYRKRMKYWWKDHWNCNVTNCKVMIEMRVIFIAYTR